MSLATVTINHFPVLKWQKAPEEAFFNPFAIAVWRINVLVSTPFLEDLKPLLSTQETEKFWHYQQETDRQHCLISKAALRMLLGQYLHVEPKLVSFVVGKNKKPELENTFGRNLHFNISHSGNWVLIAIAETPLGIDIEKMNASFTWQNLLSFGFNKQEINIIEQSALPFQSFYQLWTRKESLLKATGKGLVDELSLVPSLDGVHQNPTEIIGSVENWQVLSFPVDKNHIGSVAFMPIKTVCQFFNFQL